MHTFRIVSGLYELCPGAKFSGEFFDNIESEYNDITWLDIRVKPSWIDIEQESLTKLRQEISVDIKDKTTINIENNLRYSNFPDVPILCNQLWQWDMFVLWLINKNNLTYPYNIKVSETKDAQINYIILNSVEEFDQIIMEIFSFIYNWLATGRVERDKLASMTRTQLEEYVDLR